MGLQAGGQLKGKRRELNTELNLTSFIDLLSTCVCFLLITAVWTQINSMEVRQSHGTEASQASEQLELDLKFINAENVKITLKGDKLKKELSVENTATENFKANLSSKFSQWVNSLGQEHKLKIAAAMVHPAEGVNYARLVDALDVLRKSHITNIGIVPTKGDK